MNEKDALTAFIATAECLNEVHYYTNTLFLSVYPDRYVIEDDKGRREFDRYINDQEFIELIRKNTKHGVIT